MAWGEDRGLTFFSQPLKEQLLWASSPHQLGPQCKSFICKVDSDGYTLNGYLYSLLHCYQLPSSGVSSYKNFQVCRGIPCDSSHLEPNYSLSLINSRHTLLHELDVYYLLSGCNGHRECSLKPWLPTWTTLQSVGWWPRKPGAISFITYCTSISRWEADWGSKHACWSQSRPY